MHLPRKTLCISLLYSCSSPSYTPVHLPLTLLFISLLHSCSSPSHTSVRLPRRTLCIYLLRPCSSTTYTPALIILTFLAKSNYPNGGGELSRPPSAIENHLTGFLLALKWLCINTSRVLIDDIIPVNSLEQTRGTNNSIQTQKGPFVGDEGPVQKKLVVINVA